MRERERERPGMEVQKRERERSKSKVKGYLYTFVSEDGDDPSLAASAADSLFSKANLACSFFRSRTATVAPVGSRQIPSVSILRAKRLSQERKGRRAAVSSMAL